MPSTIASRFPRPAGNRALSRFLLAGLLSGLLPAAAQSDWDEPFPGIASPTASTTSAPEPS